MRNFLLSVVLFLVIFSSKAFHIVGGEVEFVYVRDGRYRISLVQYFDFAQSSNLSPDSEITVYIFSNVDHSLISTHLLMQTNQTEVRYRNIDCVIGGLSTLRVVYSREIALDPGLYNSSAGYYIQWERCCRNGGITNIQNPSGTGMNYVLEIPPLMKNGRIFRNSSPQISEPLSDYGCVNQPFYTDFSAVDPDGDSLGYSLVAPLNSSSQVSVPIAQPKPHFNVTFRGGYSERSMIPGSPPLEINERGQLTVTPTQTGLFAFAIKIEEYRNGAKIGESRREFQLLVVDGCPSPTPPMVDIDIPGRPAFNPETDILMYTVGDTKCFDLLVSNVIMGEVITLRAEGVNFDENIDRILMLNQIMVRGPSGLLRVEVCIPACPPLREEPFIIDFIAEDDACPLPQLDTLRLMIQVEPPPNEPPTYVYSSDRVSLAGNSVHSQTIMGIDADGDELSLSLFIEGIADPAAFGFDLTVVNSTAGSITGTFTWNTHCERFDFSRLQNFEVGILLDDNDECNVPPADTLFINANLILAPNIAPEITLNSILPGQIDVGTTLNFDVMAMDENGDDIFLSFQGENFNPDFYGIQFTDAHGDGSVLSNFNWEILCDVSRYTDGQEFELLFVVVDDARCRNRKSDTFRHTVQVNYPVNEVPVFDNIAPFRSIHVNETVQIPIRASDSDGDSITIEFDPSIIHPASSTLHLDPVKGQGSATAILEWQPECSLLRSGEIASLYDVVVQVTDNACPIANISTLRLTFEVFDEIDQDGIFLPPNVFTPNGDGKNDTFRLSGNVDIHQNLSPDRCDNMFEYIVINNRAGVRVYQSSNRDFVWSGGQLPAGIYYYLIKFTAKVFKGYIHLIK